MKKGIGPQGLGASKSPAKMYGAKSPAKQAKRVVPSEISAAEKERQEKLAAVRANSRAMKEERALIAKRKRGTKLGYTMEEMAVGDRLQEKGKTKDIKKA